MALPNEGTNQGRRGDQSFSRVINDVPSRSLCAAHFRSSWDIGAKKKIMRAL